MKEFSWLKITGLCVTISIIFGIIGGALTNEYFIGYLFSNFIQNQEENSPIVKKVIEERTFVEETLIKDAFDKGIPSVAAMLKNESDFKSSTKQQTNGTGFFITNDGLFATCKFAVAGQKTWYLKANDGIVYKAFVDYSDPDMDLAFLKIEREETTPYFKASDFSTNPMTLSQKVLVLGIDSEFNQHVKSGIVSFVGKPDKIEEYDEIDFDIDSSLNCGPVVNLGGEVQGMAVKQNKTGTTYVIPVEYINEKFLNYSK
jgi:S1-C subfamily serine protease